MSGVWGVGTILIVLFSKNSSLSLTGSVEKLRFPLNVLFCFSGKPPPLTKIFCVTQRFLWENAFRDFTLNSISKGSHKPRNSIVTCLIIGLKSYPVIFNEELTPDSGFSYTTRGNRVIQKTFV